MNNGLWKDTTTYSQTDTERIPTTYTLELNGLRITVTCGHVLYKPQWVMHCFALFIDTKPLPNCASAEEAQTRAIKIVYNKAKNILDIVSPLIQP